MLHRLPTLEETAHNGSRRALAKVVGARADGLLDGLLDMPAIFDAIIHKGNEACGDDDAARCLLVKTASGV